MRRLCATILALCLLGSASAYTLRYTDASGAVRVRWPSNRISVALSASLSNPPANVKATGAEAQRAALNALLRWEEAAGLSFDVTPFSPKLSANAGDKPDGLNLITVAATPDNLKLFAGPHAGDLARTRTVTDDAGAILSADIALNPNQLFSTDGAPGTHDLEAVLTHEVGHLLGLAESGVLGATMSPRQGWNGLYGTVAWAGRTLSADDVSGIRALYGAKTADEPRASMEGTLTWPGGAPAVGVNVWAEELTTGRVAAAGLTLVNGKYRLEGLKPDVTYRLTASVLSGPLAAGDFASAYNWLAGVENPAHAQELGLRVSLGGQTAFLSKQLAQPSPAAPRPALFGMNGELGNVALTLTAGQTYALYLSGAQLAAEDTEIKALSPHLYVPPKSVKLLDGKAFGLKEPALGFDLSVSALAATGDYSLRVKTPGGVAFLPGALTVESAAFTGLAKRRTPDELAAKPNHEAAGPIISGANVLLETLDGGRNKER